MARSRDRHLLHRLAAHADPGAGDVLPAELVDVAEVEVTIAGDRFEGADAGVGIRRAGLQHPFLPGGDRGGNDPGPRTYRHGIRDAAVATTIQKYPQKLPYSQ